MLIDHPVRRRTLLAGVVTAPLALSAATAVAAPAPAPASTPGAAPAPPLTNLGHLDELTTAVRLTPSAAHTTYRLSEEPEVGQLWVYADVRPDGSYQPVGGGAYDAATDTWGQGAYDVDDIARAAVVYLRAWQQTGSAHAREQAYRQLRGMAYYQTLTGPYAGEFVLWMQPDGTLNPTPTPPDNPNPADQGESYWTARAVWAYGEGYAAFAQHDQAFAAFLRDRMELTIAALERDVLVRYGTYHDLHGVQVPAWLITQGADATSEALLGLAAYVQATGSPAAVKATRQFAQGLAEFHRGTTTQWPFRALMPWAESLDLWHAWGSEMAQGLAAASIALGDSDLMGPAIGDTAGFTAQLLTSTGPDNGWLPVPLEKVQIAYGADARVRACYDVGVAARRDGIRRLAGIAAGWFFGANLAGVPVYDPATGVTFDGVEADGRINRNSGAESTIHGLLTMLVLDDNPELVALAKASAQIQVRNGLVVVEAETAALQGPATVETPASAWTGESSWSGQQVVAQAGAVLRWTLPASREPRLLQPVVELVPGSHAVTKFVSRRRPLGWIHHGAVGAPGDAAAPTRLTPVELDGRVAGGERSVEALVRGGTARLDALLVMPEIAMLASQSDGVGMVLLTSKSRRVEERRPDLAGSGKLVATSYDADGRSQGSALMRGRRVRIEPGGFTIVTRGL
ncbi:hypothetical protein [Propioniciclava soli]|uniref:D-glucuronyl C5-epimerase C-terminal domain-containing protein n=1 Tax=Propioniciclava soli TaxID=2775081 RepID=A0ABZ3C687_9ACTN|nr:hypothetical protein [Propioniciclava soli]